MSFLDTNGLKTLWGLITAKIGTVNTTLTTHTSNKSNPHGVTKSQVGLGSVDNVSKADILSAVYPVGSIYISVNETNPGTLFGGTWEAFGQGRTLIGAGTGNDGSTSLSFTAGETIGEYNHKLTTNEIPTHTHKPTEWGLIIAQGGNSGEFSLNDIGTNGNVNYFKHDKDQNRYTSYVGGSKSHNNIQPSIIVYMWKRVS